MTRVFTEDGVSIPVTVVEATPNHVTQIKSVETDGYSAIQVIWHDPEAAAIVFQSGVPITMYGLDVFMRPGINREQATQMQNSSNPAAQFGGSLALAFMERLGVSPVTLGDYGAVASVIRPDLFTTEMFDVVVDTSAGPARGQTLVDRRDAFLKELEPLDLEDSAKVRVTLDLDVNGVEQLWLTTINS